MAEAETYGKGGSSAASVAGTAARPSAHNWMKINDFLLCTASAIYARPQSPT